MSARVLYFLLPCCSLPAAFLRPMHRRSTPLFPGAPDLASVRAKIKAKDFSAALEELRPMLETHEHADLYNLMGFGRAIPATTSRRRYFT